MNAIDFSPFLPFLWRVSVLFLSIVLLLAALRKVQPRIRVMMVRSMIYVIPILIWGTFSDPIYRFENPFQSTGAKEDVVTIATPHEWVSGSAISAVDASVEEPANRVSLSIPAGLFLFWLTVTLVLLARDFMSLMSLKKTCRAATPADHTLASRWQEICREFGISRPVDLVVQRNSECDSPFLSPGLRPVLVLPSGMVEKYGAETLDQVFRHEAAHLSGEDTDWLPLVRFVTILFWFHPLMWVISTLHLRDCEKAADAAAARSGGADAYRKALATLALGLLPVSRPAISVAMIRVPGVSDRLRAVRENATSSPPSRGKVSLWFGAVLFIGVFLGSTGMAQNKDQATLKDFIWNNAIPVLRLEDTELKDAIATVEKISKEVDPDGEGFQIHLSEDFSRPYALITLKLTNVPFTEGLRYISALAGGEFRVTNDGVVFENKRDQKTAMLEKVSENWEIPGKWPVPGLGTTVQTVHFSDTPLSEALKFLEKKTKGQDGSGKGVRIKMADGFTNANTPISLRLSNVKIAEALRYATSLAEAAYMIDGDQVIVMDKEQHSKLLFVEVFAAPQSLFPRGDKDAKAILTEAGIDFPESSAAIYKRESGHLIVKNHQPMIDLTKEWLNNQQVPGSGAVGRVADVEKVLKMKIPVIEFAETPFEDAMAFLAMKMREMDPGGKGAAIRISNDLEGRKTPVSFRLVDIRFEEALRHITAAVDATFIVEDHISIVGKNRMDRDLYTEAFQVSPSRFADRKRSPQAVLKEAGVAFPENASAVYNRGTQQLIIRNTRSNLAKLKLWLGE